MTIKEVEERTGLTRANVRFYEDEGLIFPKRLPNGYRDYEEKDILDLEKIKLLRRLDMDINTIRLVQNGRLSLEQALFGQLNRLEGQRAALDRAAEVCRAMGSARVNYRSLQPGVWLKELERASRPAVAPPPPKPEPEATEEQKWFWTHRAYDHPWMRYFARGVDMMICRLILDLLGWLIIPGYLLYRPPVMVQWMAAVALLILTLLLEPVWLRTWGYTPGKWIFGLKLRDEDGTKLSLSQGRRRSFQVFVLGYGLNIPIFNLVRLWKSFRRCTDNRDCDWDEDEGYLYGRKPRRLSWLMAVAVYVVSLGVTLLLVFESALPLHRGPDLTVEEFCQNYNYALQMQGIDQVYAPLSDEGHWVDRNDLVLNPQANQWTKPIFTMERDRLIGVTLVVTAARDLEGQVVGKPGLTREVTAMRALSGALDLRWGEWLSDGWTTVWEDNVKDRMEDWEFTYQGIRVESSVREEETGAVIRRVTMTLVGSE